MTKDPFEQEMETFFLEQKTVVMQGNSQRIKNNLDTLREILVNHPPPSEDCPHLWVTVKEERYWFSLNKPITIGANGDTTDLQLDDDFVSGRHCEIDPSNRHWVLKDLNSKNGIFVNGRRMNEDRRLKDGDIIQLGDSSLIFVTPE